MDYFRADSKLYIVSGIAVGLCEKMFLRLGFAIYPRLVLSSPYRAQAGLKLKAILLCQLPKCLKYRDGGRGYQHT